MQITNHDEFLAAIESRREVELVFRSKEDGGAILTRRCAPMDFGPSRRARDKTPRYHVWDMESDGASNHTLSLLAEQVVSMKVMSSSFDPAFFVSWPPSWYVDRTTWGEFN